MWSNASEIATGFLKPVAYQSSRDNKKTRGVREYRRQYHFEPDGFTTEDILWTLGIWSVILGLSPVIMFYMLMVA